MIGQDGQTIPISPNNIQHFNQSQTSANFIQHRPKWVAKCKIYPQHDLDLFDEMLHWFGQGFSVNGAIWDGGAFGACGAFSLDVG